MFSDLREKRDAIVKRTSIRYVICSLHIFCALFLRLPVAVCADQGTYIHPDVHVNWAIHRNDGYVELTGSVINRSGGLLLNMELSTSLYPVQDRSHGTARFLFLPQGAPADALLPFGMRIAVPAADPARELMVSLYYERLDSEGRGLPTVQSFLVDLPLPAAVRGGTEK